VTPRLAALALAAVLAGIPAAVLPAAPVTPLAAAAVAVVAVGVLLLSRPVVVGGAALALIAYAVALALARPPADPLAAVAFGGTLVLLLVLVDFARRVRGAHVDAPVVAAQVRQWLGVVGQGAAAALGLTALAGLLGRVLAGATLPVVVVTAAVGAALAGLGVVVLALQPWHRDPGGTAVARTAGGPMSDRRLDHDGL
jgi:hypothetical protein